MSPSALMSPLQLQAIAQRCERSCCTAQRPDVHSPSCVHRPLITWYAERHDCVDAASQNPDEQGIVTVLFASIEKAQRSPMPAGPVHWPVAAPDGLQYTPTPAQFCADGSQSSPMWGIGAHLCVVSE